MAGLGIRLYTDEMIPSDLAPALRQLGFDVESCSEAGRSRQKIPDEAQLAYATQAGRAILTYNRDDFLLLDAAWKAEGQPHAGIILSREIHDFRTLLRSVQAHLDTCAPSTQHDLLLWLRRV